MSAVTTSVARILQWGEGVENDITFDYTLFTEVDPERFGGVHAILYSTCKVQFVQFCTCIYSTCKDV